MKLKQLRRVHAEYDAATWQTHADLVAGGTQLHKNISKYLARNDVEPSEVYDRRCKAAYYLGYAAPIVQYFASWLFSSPPAFKSEPEQVDPFYADFKEDVDGLGTDLDQFLRHAFIQAAIAQRAYWRVQFPEPGVTPPTTRAEWETQGLGRATLAHVPATGILNWRRDEQGAWIWVLEHDCREELLELEDEAPTVTETWTLWRADGTAQRWQVAYHKDQPPQPEDVIVEIDAPFNPVGGIPIAELRLPPELWIMNLLADGQLEHFRKSNALSWSIERTCYAMPWFFLENPKKPPTMGVGYYGILGAKDKVEWPAPPPTPYATIQEYNSKLKDELHRVSHQMAMGADNNAAALGRSADSKRSDNTATEIVLAAMGRVVREPVEKTHDMITRGRGEAVQWSVGGMDSYRIPDATYITESAVATEPLRIPSATFRREMLTKVALAQLPDADEKTKSAIRDEIANGVNPEDVDLITQERVARAQAAIQMAESAPNEDAEEPKAA